MPTKRLNFYTKTKKENLKNLWNLKIIIVISTKKSEGNYLLRDNETKTISTQDILNKETVDLWYHLTRQ